MQTNIDHTSPNLSGVKIANELRLPEQTRLTGDTVIIARNIVYQGRNVVIRGPFSLHIFVVDTTRTSSSGGTVTIDTSGHGRSEWLQTRGKVSQISATQSSVSFVRASFGGASVPVQSGQHGADGSQGIPGVSGQHGSGGGSGAAGACEGNINGGNGSAAANAGDGDYGGDGGNGGNGGNGQTVTLRISNPNDATPYNLVTRGGNGGFGGNGAYAGNGGNGGTGGNGGNGASCECKVNGVGNGGNGGNGGRAGSGGTGGDGGNGGNGGNGGSIEVYYPAGYNTNNVTYNNGGGAAGSPGTAGAGGQPGLIGSAGSPGTGGSVSSCNGSNGNGGTGGSAGSGGAGGSGGDGGSAGNAGGPPTFVQVGGGYGGGWEPGGTGYGGCTEWYWVEFECYLLDRPQFDPYHKLSFGNSPGQKLTLVNAFIDKSASGPSPESEMSSEEWECSVISSTYIGCW